MEIHENIINNLNYYVINKSIPNIIFHGKSGSGKRVLVHKFIKKIYANDMSIINTHVMIENCVLCQGINFIRNTLKEFSKITNNSNHIKIVILYNADKLTIDAQSAMRRLIEIFSNTTRFFIIVENIKCLLQPIVSRFCNIYIPYPLTNNKITNLYYINDLSIDYHKKRRQYLENMFNRLPKKLQYNNITTFATKFYNKGYSANDILEILKYEHDLGFIKVAYIYNIVRLQIRNELTLIKYLLILFYFRSEEDLENIVFN